MNPQDLHLIDMALELIVYNNGLATNAKNRQLKNAVYECMRCFHADEVWGEPYHIKMIQCAIERLKQILADCGAPVLDTTT